MHKQILFILCGLPFAGKTTVANILCEDKNLCLISLDQININRGFKPGTRIPQKEWDTSYKLANNKLEMLLKTGKSVVYDDTNYSMKHRLLLTQIAKANGYSTRLIFINTPLKVIKQRIKENTKSNARPSVHPSDLEFILTHFQKPNYLEHPIIVSGNGDIVRRTVRHFIKTKIGDSA